MRTEYSTQAAAALSGDTLILLSFEDAPVTTGIAALDEAVAALYASAEFKGKTLDTAILHNPGGTGYRRLILVGGGKQETHSPAALRKAVGTGIRLAKSKAARDVVFSLDSPRQHPPYAAAAVEGAITGEWEPDRLKTDPEKNEKRIASFILSAPGASADLQAAFERGRIVAESQNFARELANEPGNLMNPQELARRARAMAEECGLTCDILDRDRMRQLGMGALLGVAQGSEEPPALIVIQYIPEKPANDSAHLGLVGKAVTFDTGGISIKPADGMEKMKYDMSGGAAVLGALRALSLLKPPIPVTGLIPSVENMPGGRAQRPGDIVKSLNGKTVEVLNTDAEGRLILIDAITYAQRLGCTHLVDAATLTGAIVVALGHVHAGAFTNNEEMLARVQGAARSQGENLWHMPLDEDYKEQLKSAFADLPNIGTRWGGAVTAAYFLKEFADPTPWVHLDIAGTAWLDDAKPFMAKGPTGVCVRTFVELALSWNSTSGVV